MSGKNHKHALKELKNQVFKRLEREGIGKLPSILTEVKQSYAEMVKGKVRDVDQSWRPFKGKLLEEIIEKLLEKSLEDLGLKVVRGNIFQRSDSKLDECLAKVKRSMLVDYGEFGFHLPDADLVVYDSHDCEAKLIISVKATLRERVAQTGYWKLKLSLSPITKKIKLLFITLDEDQDLKQKFPAKKGRAIVEKDTDGAFVVTDDKIEESDKVKKIDKLTEFLRNIFRSP